jgi:hypothetical protein
VDSARSRLCIGRRFCGPPGAANGGFASGSLAALLGGTVDVEVSLRRSVPLERPLGVRHDGDTLLLEDDGWLLAEARPAAGRGPYYGDPLFPDCFVCGPARAPGDGLRIFPGRVPRHRLVAWLLGRDGRKLTAGSALLGSDGEVVAAARALWVTVARTAGGSR